MYCNKCGKEAEDKAKFCTFCGTQLPTDPAEVSSLQEVDEAPSRKEPIGIVGLIGVALVLVGFLCPFVDTWYYKGNLFDIINSMSGYAGESFLIICAFMFTALLASVILLIFREPKGEVFFSAAATILFLMMVFSRSGLHTSSDEAGAGCWISLGGFLLMLLSPFGNRFTNAIKSSGT